MGLMSPSGMGSPMARSTRPGGPLKSPAGFGAEPRPGLGAVERRLCDEGAQGRFRPLGLREVGLQLAKSATLLDRAEAPIERREGGHLFWPPCGQVVADREVGGLEQRQRVECSFRLRKILQGADVRHQEGDHRRRLAVDQAGRRHEDVASVRAPRVVAVSGDGPQPGIVAHGRGRFRGPHHGDIQVTARDVPQHVGAGGDRHALEAGIVEVAGQFRDQQRRLPHHLRAGVAHGELVAAGGDGELGGSRRLRRAGGLLRPGRPLHAGAGIGDGPGRGRVECRRSRVRDRIVRGRQRRHRQQQRESEGEREEEPAPHGPGFRITAGMVRNRIHRSSQGDQRSM